MVDMRNIREEHCIRRASGVLRVPLPLLACRGFACVVALVIASGCGKDGTEPPHAPKQANKEIELLRRVSAALEAGPGELAPRDDVLAYANLAAARRQLGLPKDARFPGPGSGQLLSSLAMRPMFLFAPMLWGPPRLGPLGDLLDTGAIDALAGTSFAFAGPLADEVSRDDVLVVRTRQPFDEIAERLRLDYDYQGAADGLLIGEPIDRRSLRFAAGYDGIPFPAVAHAGVGVVVFGGSARAARAAADDARAELTPAAGLVAELPGVGRLAQGGYGCVVLVGLYEEAQPREGAVVVVVDGEARPGRFLFSGLKAAGIAKGTRVTFAEAMADGAQVSSRFTSTDHVNATRLPIEDVERPYGCAAEPDRPAGITGRFR